MVKCVVRGCSARSERDCKHGARFFSIPAITLKGPPHVRKRSERRRSLWLARINRSEQSVSSYSRVCSGHFISGAPASISDETSVDWAPSCCLDLNEFGSPNANTAAENHCSLGGPIGASEADESLSEAVNDDDADSFTASAYLAEQSLSGAQPSPSNDIHSSHCANLELLSTVCTSDSAETTPAEFLNAPVSEGCFTVGEHSTDDCHEGSHASDSNAVSDSVANVIETELYALREEHLELQVAYTKLRNELSEVQVDKLELGSALEQATEQSKKYEQENNLLRQEYESVSKSTTEKIERIKLLEQQLACFQCQMVEVEKKLDKSLKCTLPLSKLQSDKDFVKFYTGLPSYEVFEIVLNHVNAHIKEPVNVALAPWQCCLLTLMRLRLSLTLQDLSYRFGVSVATACRTFERWLHYLYVCLDPLINWPERETLYLTMPVSFKEAFGSSVAVIVDCFEVYIDRPASLDSRAMTWSNYKHHNTIKFLIGITPCGAISFISEAWGGRASDKHVTLNSGLLGKLLPGDVIMADRGFTVGEDVAFYCAKLITPAFTRGQAQLSSHDISDTRKIASLRIHVERVIGLLRRKYSILKSTLSVEMLNVKPGHEKSQIDEIIRVCCALTNMSDSVVG